MIPYQRKARTIALPILEMDEELVERMVRGILEHDKTDRAHWRLAEDYRVLIRQGLAALDRVET